MFTFNAVYAKLRKMSTIWRFTSHRIFYFSPSPLLFFAWNCDGTASIYSLRTIQQQPHMFTTHTTCEHVNNETTYNRSFVVSRPCLSNGWVAGWRWLLRLLSLNSWQTLCHFNNKGQRGRKLKTNFPSRWTGKRGAKKFNTSLTRKQMGYKFNKGYRP